MQTNGPADYDLPTTNKATDMVAAAPAKDDEKKSLAPGELTEEQRWARNRTGWAPQFAKPDASPDEEETLLDHRTFLEDKISDKFFGGLPYPALLPWASS